MILLFVSITGLQSFQNPQVLWKDFETVTQLSRCNNMEKITRKDIEKLIKSRRSPGGKGLSIVEKAAWKKILLRVFIVTACVSVLISLPFILLVRISVYLKLSHGFSGWVSLGGGVLATILLLLIYIFLLFRNFRNKKLLLHYSLAGVSTMVLGFCMFSLFYLSGMNAKSQDVRELYKSLHPVLRVAITSVTLADGDLVITDIGRDRADYERMGLPVNHTSLHYRQDTGYVHAVDLRTRDRGFVRNALLRFSLEVMGFQTLRHIGTADHLHVELSNYKS